MEFDVAATILSPAERDLPHGNGEQAGIRELPPPWMPVDFCATLNRN